MTQRWLLLQKKLNELCWQIIKLPSNLANELQSLHAQMLVALHDPTNYDDVETALNTTVESMTGLETMNEKEKVDAEKFIHQHVTVNVNRKKSEEDRKRHGWQSCPRKKNCMLWRQNGELAVPSGLHV